MNKKNNTVNLSLKTGRFFFPHFKNNCTKYHYSRISF